MAESLREVIILDKVTCPVVEVTRREIGSVNAWEAGKIQYPQLANESPTQVVCEPESINSTLVAAGVLVIPIATHH